MTDTVQDRTLRTRRSLLTAAAGGAAALAVGAIKPGAVSAGVNLPVLQNEDNATVLPTGVTNSTNGGTALYGHAALDGRGVEGSSVEGPGVYGLSPDTSDPENNTKNAGVVGIAGDQADVATNYGLTGVYGYADTAPLEGWTGAGVWGDSPDIGVAATGSMGVWANGGWGVRALTGNGIGVYTSSDSIAGLALLAQGRAAFSRSGRTTIKSGNAKKVVSLGGVTASSLVFAVLAQNRSGRYVRAAVPESGKFTIYLNQNVSSDTKVSWIVFTNPSNGSG
jgi:hypothetical protein